MQKTVQEQLGYEREARLVMAHVDDLGMHRDETDGSMEVLRFGMARTGSVMVPAPDYARFAELWREDPSLDIGVHLTLNSEWEEYRWPAVLPKEEVPSLYDEEGYLWRNQELFYRNASMKEAAAEMEAQVEAVLDAGLSPTHIDPHMYTAFQSDELIDALVRIAERHRLAIPFAPPHRREELRERGFLVADSFNGFYHIEGEEADPSVRQAAYRRWMEERPPGLHYLYLHPARVTPELRSIIEMPHIRQNDYAVWTSLDMRRFAEQQGIRFVGCRELQAVL